MGHNASSSPVPLYLPLRRYTGSHRYSHPYKHPIPTPIHRHKCVVTCAQQIASAALNFCGYISVAPTGDNSDIDGISISQRQRGDKKEEEEERKNQEAGQEESQKMKKAQMAKGTQESNQTDGFSALWYAKII